MICVIERLDFAASAASCHVNEFAEILANRPLQVVMDKSPSPNVFHLVVNAVGKCGPMAAEEAYVDLTEVLSLVHNRSVVEIRPGSVNTLNADTGQMKPVHPQMTSSIRSQAARRSFAVMVAPDRTFQRASEDRSTDLGSDLRGPFAADSHVGSMYLPRQVRDIARVRPALALSLSTS
ncbi:unnamed protein product [Toxocara canis]|uniref:Uncharacterized protein n=1 Tax=Toxocara canis TaxID=6265 RepID=A0A183U3S6_TOXCA|nr:unnamed protein product [Toxocara canis]